MIFSISTMLAINIINIGYFSWYYRVNIVSGTSKPDTIFANIYLNWLKFETMKIWFIFRCSSQISIFRKIAIRVLPRQKHPKQVTNLTYRAGPLRAQEENLSIFPKSRKVEHLPETAPPFEDTQLFSRPLFLLRIPSPRELPWSQPPRDSLLFRNVRPE